MVAVKGRIFNPFIFGLESISTHYEVGCQKCLIVKKKNVIKPFLCFKCGTSPSACLNWENKTD